MPTNDPIFCPSCNEPADRQGNKIVCVKCDVVYKLVKDEPRVEKIGWKEQIEKRMAALEDQDGPGGQDTEADVSKEDGSTEDHVATESDSGEEVHADPAPVVDDDDDIIPSFFQGAK